VVIKFSIFWNIRLGLFTVLHYSSYLVCPTDTGVWQRTDQSSLPERTHQKDKKKLTAPTKTDWLTVSSKVTLTLTLTRHGVFCLLPVAYVPRAYVTLRPSILRRYLPLKLRLTFIRLQGVAFRRQNSSLTPLWEPQIQQVTESRVNFWDLII
jgi:hypothetical protein